MTLLFGISVAREVPKASHALWLLIGCIVLLAAAPMLIWLAAMNAVDAYIWISGCELPDRWWYQGWDKMFRRRKR
jgi:hypothetical protein